MKFVIGLLISTITLSAFGDDLAKAFEKRKEKDCTRLLSEIRKGTRKDAGLTDKIEKAELGTNKDSKFALLYLKLKTGEICSEQPSRTERGSIIVQYVCRDKSGKETFSRAINGGHSECTGDAPKFQ